MYHVCVCVCTESTEVIMKLGEKYGDLGYHNRAIEFLKKATELDPYFVIAYTALGNNLASVSPVPEWLTMVTTNQSYHALHALMVPG